jgi:hypothetical protein
MTNKPNKHIWQTPQTWAWLEPGGPRNYVARLHVCTKGIRGGIREVVAELGAEELRAAAQAFFEAAEQLEALRRQHEPR